jgi:site-specific recombinase XerD
MAANADISTVRDILGQKSTVSTQVYAKVSLESKMEVVNLTDGLFD